MNTMNTIHRNISASTSLSQHWDSPDNHTTATHHDITLAIDYNDNPVHNTTSLTTTATIVSDFLYWKKQEDRKEEEVQRTRES